MEMEEFARRTEAVQGRLYRTACLYLGGESAAAEALDEAVFRGVDACRRLRDPALFETWLTRILINVCQDELRRRKRLAGAEELPETAVEPYDALPLREAVARLPKDLRAVVILRWFSGYTLRETADILQIPQGTAATRQRKALALLRLELDEEGGT